MANVSRPVGFRPLRHLNGAPYNGQAQTFLIPSTDGTAVYVGDLVKFAGSSGAAGTLVSGMDCEGMATVAAATAQTTGLDLAGVVVGFLANATIPTKHRAASENRIALVITDLSVVYEIQEDADTTPIAAASVGLSCAYASAAGSTVTGMSGYQLDSSTAAATSTLPLKILGLVKRVDNALNTGGSGVDKAKFEVLLNTSWFAVNNAGA